MSHIVQISDERYSLLERLATEHGKTAEELLNALLDELWEQECAGYDAAFYNDPGWVESARQADETARGGQQRERYMSTEEFFRHLGASAERLDEVRRIEQGAGHADSR